MKPTVIMFSAPPRSGKTECINAIYNKYKDEYNFLIEKTSDQLRNAIAALLGYTYEDFLAVYEQIKDESQSVFGGKTVREAMIDLSESYLKPTYGRDIFGKLFVEKITDPNPIILMDVGFVEEIEPIKAKFGAENLFLITIERPECTYENDSRVPLNAELIGIPTDNHWNIENDGDVGTLRGLAGFAFNEIMYTQAEEHERSEEDRLYYFYLSFIGQKNSFVGGYTVGGSYIGLYNKTIGIEAVNEAREASKMPESSALTSVNYLGYMTPAEFKGESK